MLKGMKDDESQYIPEGYEIAPNGLLREKDATKTITDEKALESLGINWQDDEALKRLSRMKLARIVATCPATTASLPVIRELLDRLEGKPTQRIEQKLEVNSKHTVIELSTSDIMAELNRLGMQTLHVVSADKTSEPITIKQ